MAVMMVAWKVGLKVELKADELAEKKGNKCIGKNYRSHKLELGYQLP
jgi:hypothetical protein